jgi:ABC-2 type transport system ATP-binding protein
MASLEQLLPGLPGARQVRVHEDHVQIFFENGSMDPAAVNRFCFEKGITLKHLQLRKRSLESKFMELTK